MVNPLASNSPPAVLNPIGVDPEPPVARAEPAVRVIGAGETLNGNGVSRGTTPSDAAGFGGDKGNALDKALEFVNSNMGAWSTGMRFDMDDEAQRLVVSIIDNKTGEVLRTVPSEAVIRVAKMIVHLQGQGVNTKA